VKRAGCHRDVLRNDADTLQRELVRAVDHGGKRKCAVGRQYGLASGWRGSRFGDAGEHYFASCLAAVDDAVDLGRASAGGPQLEVNLVADGLAFAARHSGGFEATGLIGRPVSLDDLKRKGAGRVQKLVVACGLVRIAAREFDGKLRAPCSTFPRHLHLDPVARCAACIGYNSVEEPPVVGFLRRQQAFAGHFVSIPRGRARRKLDALGLPAVQCDAVDRDARQ